MKSHGTRVILVFSLLAALLMTGTVARAGSADIYLQSLTDFENYAETVWHAAAYSNAPVDSGYWGDGKSTGNGGIRGNGGVALAYAVLCLAEPASPEFARRLSRVRQALNYNADKHTTGVNTCVNGARWGWNSGVVVNCGAGADWQTSLWTGEMALAALLLQTNLPVATVSNVQHVLASEATHRAGLLPCSGYLSDTKAEENGWDDPHFESHSRSGRNAFCYSTTESKRVIKSRLTGITGRFCQSGRLEQVSSHCPRQCTHADFE